MKTQLTFKRINGQIGKFTTLLLCLVFSLNSFAGPVPHTVLTQRWVGGVLENYSLVTNTYTGNKLTATLYQEWNTNAWQNVTLVSFTYDANGHLFQSISQRWDSTVPPARWFNELRISYTYNAAGKVLTTLIENSPDGVAWANSLLMTNSYDASNYLINSLSQTAVAGTINWQNAFQTTFTNNATGYPIIEISQVSPDGISWINTTKTLLTYDASNNITQEIMQTWSFFTNDWVNSRRITNTYSGSNKPLTVLNETWNSTVWVNDTLETNTYDGNDYLTQNLLQNWTGLPNWENDTRYLFTNNADGSAHIIDVQNWNTATTVWDNYEKITIDSILAIQAYTNEKSIAIFPNPAHDIVTIKTNDSADGSTYFITDQMGKQVMTGKLNRDETTVDINKLAAGLYVFQIDSHNKQSVKLIKR